MQPTPRKQLAESVVHELSWVNQTLPGEELSHTQEKQDLNRIKLSTIEVGRVSRIGRRDRKLGSKVSGVGDKIG
jgi:hypothetical protein